MKCTLLITQQCNLRCSYCYIQKKDSVMSLETAQKIIDSVFSHTPIDEKIDFGCFGGEPLLEFDRVKAVVDLVENHPQYDASRVEFAVVTNGTIFSSEIAEYINDHNIVFCLSCDGPPTIHNKFRRYADGSFSSHLVEKTIINAIDALPEILVNAVYHPRTYMHLPQVVDYFSSLGIKKIYLNPDYSATWTKNHSEKLFEVYKDIGSKYIHYYLKDDPHYISIIDSKIIAILKGGYKPDERCKMGRGEFAFAPSGNIYPCERLVGNDDGNNHCIGNISFGLSNVCTCRFAINREPINIECQTCSLSKYCMNWCGCSNFFTSGSYDKVGPLLCISEKAAIKAAIQVFQSMENELGPIYVEKMLNLASGGICRNRSDPMTMHP